MWHRGVWSVGSQSWKEIFTKFCIYLYNSTAGCVSGCRFNLLRASPVKALKTGVVKKCPIWGHILESEKYFFSLGSFGKSFHIIEFEYYERCASQKQKQIDYKECSSISPKLFDHFIYTSCKTHKMPYQALTHCNWRVFVNLCKCFLVKLNFLFLVSFRRSVKMRNTFQKTTCINVLWRLCNVLEGIRIIAKNGLFQIFEWVISNMTFLWIFPFGFPSPLSKPFFCKNCAKLPFYWRWYLRALFISW